MNQNGLGNTPESALGEITADQQGEVRFAIGAIWADSHQDHHGLVHLVDAPLVKRAFIKVTNGNGSDPRPAGGLDVALRLK